MTFRSEPSRETPALNFIDELYQDLRYALRAFMRDPGFSLIATLTLALGIGANTAIFSVLDGVLLRPAPVDDLGRLVMVWETDRNTGTTREPGSVPDYFDYRQRSRTLGSLATFLASEVNMTPAAGDPARLAAMTVSPDLFSLIGVQPLDATLARSISQRRFAMLLLGLFAAVALTLAAVGIHGVVAYGVSQRTREIGIRMALGAERGSVFRLVAGEMLVLTLIAVAIGLAGSLALTRLLTGLMFAVSPQDPLTFVAAALFLAAVAMLSSTIPARRATRIDPARALRDY